LTPSPSRLAVVVPAPRLELDDDQRVSLAHLAAHLGRYDTFLAVPDSISGTIDELPTRRFDARFFTSHRGYNSLMLSPRFYSAFRDYEFMLVYQLDSLAFRDDLERWCDLGYDYVGAPWTRRDADRGPYFTGAGNGGFSLRRVETCLRAVQARMRPGPRARIALSHALAIARRAARGPAAVATALRTPYLFEDKFLALHASALVRGFRVAPAHVAVGFAFETEPRFCFAQNGGRLPTGCHRWAVNDPEFWRPFLLTGGEAR
jgi:hypothetical protein